VSPVELCLLQIIFHDNTFLENQSCSFCLLVLLENLDFLERMLIQYIGKSSKQIFAFSEILQDLVLYRKACCVVV